MTARRAFVAGCQRSGTTLLRFLLGAHPGVRSVDEAAAYPELTGAAPAPAGDQLAVYKIPRFAEQLLAADVRDELYGSAPQFYRREPVVFVVRDPRDVVASMCSLKAGRDRSWIDAYGRAMLEHRLAARPEFVARHGARCDALRRRDWPPHLTAALYWQVRNEALPAYLAAGLPVLPLGYERLVAEPRPALQAICRRFGLTWDERMLRHQEVEHDQLDANGLAIGNSDPKRAIDRDSVGRHRKLLAPDAAAEVTAATDDLFTELQRLIANAGANP